MRDTIKLGLRLFVFSLVAAALLAACNEITKGPIQRRAEQIAAAAREDVLPGADEYEAVPFDPDKDDRYPGLGQVFKVLRGDKLMGYALDVSVTGYKGPIDIALAVNESGSINAVSINAQNESAGVGTRITEDAFLSQFSGKAADPDTIGREVDAITGATVSSAAVISGVELALRYARDELRLEPHPGEVITREILSQFEELEARTGTTGVSPVSPYVAAGYPSIRAVYSARYGGQEAFLFELEDSTVVLSKDGTLLMLEGDRSALESVGGYFDQFLKGGMGK